MKNTRGTSKMSNRGDFTVKYTTKDVMDKLDSINKKIDSIHTQTKLTNGRVTSNEASFKRLRNIVYTSIGIVFSALMGFILMLVR